MEHEYIAIIPEVFESDMPMTIGVDKIGGGTLGSRYDGQWNVYWYDNGDLREHHIVTTGMYKRHDQVAAIAGDFFIAGLDTDDTWTTHDRVSFWAQDLLSET